MWTDSAKTTWVEVGTGSHLAAYTVSLSPSTHVPQLVAQWNIATGATSPLVAGGVLYTVGGSSLRAYNPSTGALLWTGATGSIHWQSPVVDGGTVLVEDGSGHLTAWRLPGT